MLAGENSKEIINAFKLSIRTENFASKENLVALASITGTLFAYFSIVILNIGDKCNARSILGKEFLVLTEKIKSYF